MDRPAGWRTALDPGYGVHTAALSNCGTSVALDLDAESLHACRAPALRMLWGRQDVVAEHRRRYTRTQLATVVETAGFEVLRLSYFNFCLFPPVLLLRLLMRPFSRRTAVRSDFDVPAPLGLNRVLTRLFAAEGRILQRFNLPIGVSLICLARPKAGAVSQL